MRATAPVQAVNEFGEAADGAIAIERALTIYLDKREIVTLMTLGNYPELLVLGWLLNQRLVKDISAIKQIYVDWDVEAAAISTRDGVDDLDERLSKNRNQRLWPGTVFGDLMEDIDNIKLQQPTLTQSSTMTCSRRLTSSTIYTKVPVPCTDAPWAPATVKSCSSLRTWVAIMQLMPLPATCGSTT